jgi:hypothetical protein
MAVVGLAGEVALDRIEFQPALIADLHARGRLLGRGRDGDERLQAGLEVAQDGRVRLQRVVELEDRVDGLESIRELLFDVTIGELRTLS